MQAVLQLNDFLIQICNFLLQIQCSLTEYVRTGSNNGIFILVDTGIFQVPIAVLGSGTGSVGLCTTTTTSGKDQVLVVIVLGYRRRIEIVNSCEITLRIGIDIVDIWIAFLVKLIRGIRNQHLWTWTRIALPAPARETPFSRALDPKLQRIISVLSLIEEYIPLCCIV